MIRRLHISLLLLLLLLPLTAVGQGVVRSEESAHSRAFNYYYMQALTCKEQGDYASALDLFEHCLAISPDEPSLLFEIYPIYRYLGRDDEALSMLERAVAGDPNNFWYGQQLATYHIQKGDYEKATELYEELSEKNKSNSELYIVLMQLYEELSQYDKAVSALERYERVEGANESTALQKYAYYCGMNEESGALATIRQLIKENPDDARYKVYLGETYMLFNHPNSAYKCYSDILAADSTNLLAQYSISNYYKAENKDSLYCSSIERLLFNEKLEGEARLDATREYIQYKVNRSAVADIHSIMDSLMRQPYAVKETSLIYADYMILNDVSADSVVPVVRTLLQYEPENQAAHIYILTLALQNEDLPAVIDCCNGAIPYFPEMLELYYYKGLAYANMDRPNDAIEAFIEGAARCRDAAEADLLSDVFMLLGDAYHQLGEYDKCYEAYDSALVYNSDNVTLKNNYAYFLSLNDERLDYALEMSLAAIKARPEDTNYMDTYAWILFKLGRYEEARAYVEKMIATEEEFTSDIYVHIGDIYSKCGDIERALQYWIKAQEAGDNSKTLARKIKKRKYIPDGRKKK